MDSGGAQEAEVAEARIVGVVTGGDLNQPISRRDLAGTEYP